MKMRLKQISCSAVCLLSLLLFIPLSVAAEDDSDNNGEMKLKMDRIGGDGAQNYQNTETEKEKRFPHLFNEETKEVIESKQSEEEATVQELEEVLFTMDVEDVDTVLEDTKQELFNEEYTAPAADNNQDNSQEESNSGWSTALYIGFAGLAAILCMGIYAMFQRFSG